MALLRRRNLGSRSTQIAFDTLHTVSLMGPALREGLTGSGAERVVRQLRALLGVTAVALTSDGQVSRLRRRLAPPRGRGQARRRRGAAHREDGRASGHGSSPAAPPTATSGPSWPARWSRATRWSASLVAYGPSSSALLVRAVDEVARWVSTQLELAAASRQQARAAEAELRALRAQISPHFVYNTLTAVASFTRTDPDRARELLLEFADFTRYALRRGGAAGHRGRRTAQHRALPRPGAGPLRRAAAPSGCAWRRRCCRSRCRSWSSSRWSRTPCGTGWRAPPSG